jgi:hypothetical protein
MCSAFFNGRIVSARLESNREPAVPSTAEHAAFEEMVLAQGLGHADRQAPRDEEGDRGPGASVGRDHAPHLG